MLARYKNNFQHILVILIIFGVLTLLYVSIQFTSTNNNNVVYDEQIGDIWAEKRRLTEQKYRMSEIEKRLFSKLESIQKSCGEVCNTRTSGTPGKVRSFKTILASLTKHLYTR
jgi:hypothetical protein